MSSFTKIEKYSLASKAPDLLERWIICPLSMTYGKWLWILKKLWRVEIQARESPLQPQPQRQRERCVWRPVLHRLQGNNIPQRRFNQSRVISIQCIVLLWKMRCVCLRISPTATSHQVATSVRIWWWMYFKTAFWAAVSIWTFVVKHWNSSFT